MVKFSGMAGVLGGLSVAFKQMIPDQKINLRWHEFRVHVCIVSFLLCDEND